MEIGVDGWRASPADWKAARSLPADQLPALTDEQRLVAHKLGIAEDEYARSVSAGHRTQEALLQKTERLARVLEKLVSEKPLQGQISRVLLRTLDHRFDVEVDLGGRKILMRIDEDIVDDYFESGSVDAEKSLLRVVDRALMGLTA